MDAKSSAQSSVAYRDSDIAIIGIGCRFPGGASGPQKFWNLLVNGVDAITEAPATRTGFHDLFDPDSRKPGRLYSRWGGFIEGVENFDADFFGISPREASHIDPQHRLLLEVVWEACEDAGLPATRLAGSRTGVFVGISTHDYGDMQTYPSSRGDIDLYTNSGTATSIAANRISYIYDLRGPSMTVDTACSSALTAVHVACQNLRAGDCDLAIAAGVQLVLTPELTIGFCKASMLSRDGRCKAFDDEANGYVRGEGAGVVLLKPLKAAIADGDPIYAVIRATAINEDGHTQGMTVPSRVAQQAMLETALAKAELHPADIQYVEAHGPGTSVGDPIEAGAIGAALSQGRGAGAECAIGSVKTNIGHLEAASGMAGLIKLALALKHRQLPPSLHYRQPNHAIDFESLRLRVVTALQPWPNPDRPLLAGVNSFGFGGANAHAILQEPPPVAELKCDIEDTQQLLALSARSPEALKSLAASCALLVEQPDSPPLEDICYTAAECRAHHHHRVAIVGRSKHDFADSLASFVAGENRLNIASARASISPPKLCFVFSGMGPQWWGMGRQLRAQEPVFRDAIAACDAAMRSYADWSLLEELSKGEDDSRVASPEFAQVTNFAIQYALTRLWASYGVVPDAVIGHSGGAMAAAHVAGVHNLEDSVRLCYHRSRLQGRPANSGKMLAVGAPFAEISDVLKGSEDKVSLAAVNGPATITLAGDPATLERISATLQERRVFTRMLPVTIAYHSPAMDKIKDEFLAAMKGLRGQKASLQLLSDTIGTWSSGEFDSHYWWTAIRQPVLFYEGMKQIIASGIHHFVEIAPHPVLSASVVECLKDQDVTGSVVPSIRRNENEREILLRSLGSLYCLGCSPNWSAVKRGSARLVSLPTYPWQKQRLWFEPTSKPELQSYAAHGKPGDHPLLGLRTSSARPTWESRVGDSETAYLKDHLVQGSAVFPGAAYVELVFSARKTIDPQSGVLLRNIELLKPMVLGEDGTELQLAFDSDGRHFEVFSSPREDSTSWISHARGSIAPIKRGEQPSLDIDSLARDFETTIDPTTFYDRAATRGLAYGPAFRGIHSLKTTHHRALGNINVPDLPDGDLYHVHPALLDAAFQLLVAAAETDETLRDDHRLFLPTQIREARLHSKAGSEFWAIATITEISDAHVTGDVQLIDRDHRVCAEIRGLHARLVEAAGSSTRDKLDQFLYEYRWEPKRRRPAPAPVSLPISLVANGLTSDRLQSLNDRAASLARQSGWTAYYEEVERLLNDLASAYAAQAFRDLGFGFAPGSQLSLNSLADVKSDSWRQKLAHQLCLMLEFSGLLRRNGDYWQATGKEIADPQFLAGALLQKHPLHRLDVELLARCGPRLADVVTGKVDGKDVLFTADGFAFLESFYRGAPASAFYNALTAEVVAELTADREQTRPLYVLEVGAGTGGTTSHLLPNFEGAVNYVFSDVSKLFLDRAESKFADCLFLGTQTLDLTQDFTSQGSQPRTFDVIIGANVLHATPRVEPALEQLRSLLAPGGVLLLLEITSHPWWLDIAFGLMDTWWTFEDRDLRPEHPLLPGEKWQSLLTQNGFHSPAIIADRLDEEPAQSLIVAQSPVASENASAHLGPAKHWLLFADHSGVAARLAMSLEAFGHTSTLVYAGDHYAREAGAKFTICYSSPDDLSRLRDDLSPLLASAAGVVHLWSLDLDATDDTLTTFHRAQDLGPASVTNILQRLMQALPGEPTLALVTAAAQPTGSSITPSLQQTPLWGYGRVLFKELPLLRCRMIDLSHDPCQAEIIALAQEIIQDEPGKVEEEIALRGDDRLVHRLRSTSLGRLSESLPSESLSTIESWRAEVGATGSLDSVAFRRADRRAPGPGEVEVAVHAASLNFRDIVLTTGIVSGLESDNTFGKKMLGSDFAGTIVRCGESVSDLQSGDEVLGIAPSSFSSFATTRSALVVKRPQRLSAEDAANIPVAYVTAWYGLKRLAHLSPGESVLIHAATGGVGLAAIQIARSLGSTIFATAGSEAKRSHLRSLGIEHVMDSRSLDFADQIRDITSGLGVDVVLNSLPAEALAAGVACLAPYGRFVELGKADIYQNQALELGHFRRNLSFFAVDLDRMSLERPELVGEMLQEVVDRFRSGAFTSLPKHVYEMRRLPEGLRFMAQARHIGKVVVRNDGPVAVRPKAAEDLPVRADATYLITGGLGGLGISTAQWLVQHGARSLVLVGRSVPNTDTQAAVNQLVGQGARVEVRQCDVTSPRQVEAIIGFIAANMAPLRGIIHAAMVLDDKPINELSRYSLDQVMSPKILGAWNLHLATENLTLDFFVSFSSITSLMGNPHQANYAAANTWLDAFAGYRRAHGLPATTINWGVIGETGYVSRHPEVAEYLARQGYLSFTAGETLEVLGEILKVGPSNVMAARIDWKKLQEFAPRFGASSRIRHLIPNADGTKPAAAVGSIRIALENANPGARKSLLEEYLRTGVGKLLGRSGSSLELERPLTELGMDSLIAAELTVLLERDFGVQFDGSQLLAGLNLAGLAQVIQQRLWPSSPSQTSALVHEPQSVAPVPLAAPSSDGEAPPLVRSSTPISAPVAPAESPRRATQEPVKREQSPVAAAAVVVPETATARSGIDYRSLDYSRWSGPQTLVRGISKSVFALLGSVEVQGLENVPRRGPCLLAINHLSMTEVPLLLNLLPRRAIVIVNSKYEKVRAIDWIISGLGQAIYITPGEPREESLQPALDVLGAGGILSLAPEGTRSRTGALQRARTGVAYLAMRTNVPVVPLASWGHEQWIARLKRGRRVPVQVRIGPAIPVPRAPITPLLLREYTDQVMYAIAGMLPHEYRGVYSDLNEREFDEVSAPDEILSAD